jgi:hypothetical protein
VFEVCCEHIKSFSELPLKGKSVNEPTGGEVLKGKANASENCDLVLVFTPILDARDYTWLRITENQRDKLPRYGSGLRGRSFESSRADNKKALGLRRGLLLIRQDPAYRLTWRLVPPKNEEGIPNYFEITPQAIRSPAFPDGSLFRSSAFA